jgi:hypothetical protein
MKHVFISHEREIVGFLLCAEDHCVLVIPFQSHDNFSFQSARRDRRWDKNENRMDFISHKERGDKLEPVLNGLSARH